MLHGCGGQVGPGLGGPDGVAAQQGTHGALVGVVRGEGEGVGIEDVEVEVGSVGKVVVVAAEDAVDVALAGADDLGALQADGYHSGVAAAVDEEGEESRLLRRAEAGDVGQEVIAHAEADVLHGFLVEAVVGRDGSVVGDGRAAEGPGQGGALLVGDVQRGVVGRHGEGPVVVRGAGHRDAGGNGEKDAGDFDINVFFISIYREISDHPGIAVVTTFGDWRKDVVVDAADDYSSCSNDAAYINAFTIGAVDGVTVLFGTVLGHFHSTVPTGVTHVVGDAGALCEGVARLQNRQVHRRGVPLVALRPGPDAHRQGERQECQFF